MDDIASDLTGPGIKLQPYRTSADVLNRYANWTTSYLNKKQVQDRFFSATLVNSQFLGQLYIFSFFEQMFHGAGAGTVASLRLRRSDQYHSELTL